MASLINIEKPNFFWGPSYYSSKVKFYKDSSEYLVSSAPIVDLKPINSQGFLFKTNLHISPAIGGEQSNSGLVSEKGDKASTLKTAFGLGVGYFPTEKFGMGGGECYGLLVKQMRPIQNQCRIQMNFQQVLMWIIALLKKT